MSKSIFSRAPRQFVQVTPTEVMHHGKWLDINALSRADDAEIVAEFITRRREEMGDDWAVGIESDLNNPSLDYLLCKAIDDLRRRGLQRGGGSKE